MGGGNEQRVAIKFSFKDGLSATETLGLVKKACGNEAVNRSNVFSFVQLRSAVEIFFLLHGNVPAHKAVSVCQILTQNKC
jgi:hypothetical protein